MDPHRLRAEQLLTLSSAARRIGEIVAVAEAPVRYEALRHLLRVSEETMTEVLEEAVSAQLVKRASDPFTYEPHDTATGAAIAAGIEAERTARIRAQIARATRDVREE
ncbi:MAG: hypothetical protein IVW36_07275 [Dehalococcoidia bacterium]|nr:hypothetical protein [Dehalococcoidia bacterium]